MPRPRKFESDADKSRAFREAKKIAAKKAEEEHELLQMSVRRLRQAFLTLPASLKGDQSAGHPESMVASLDQVSVFLESLATLYPASVPESGQDEKKLRNKR